MSFILDALRKSEHERQRTNAPGLSHVPLATPRRELPRWVVIVIGMLGAAVLVLGGAWWQSARAPRDSASAPVARTDTRRELPIPAPTQTLTPAPSLSAPGATRSLSQAIEAESAAATPPRTTTTSAAPLAAATGPTAHEQPALPSAASLAAQGIVLPTLRLELHAYAERPSDRFVFINGRKYVEGDRLADGPELLTIAPNGAVLRHLGQRFLLTPE